MAELSKGDVQQAVHDGIRNLQNDLRKISMQTQQIDGIQRTLHQLQQEIMNIERVQQQSSAIEQRLGGIVGDVQEIKLRVGAIEKFCAAMSAYMQAQNELEEEDEQYRKA